MNNKEEKSINEFKIEGGCGGGKIKWIYKPNKLPEIGQKVLIYEDLDWQLLEYRGNGSWYWFSTEEIPKYYERPITHWLPLPSPYKDEHECCNYKWHCYHLITEAVRWNK